MSIRLYPKSRTIILTSAISHFVQRGDLDKAKKRGKALSVRELALKGIDCNMSCASKVILEVRWEKKQGSDNGIEERDDEIRVSDPRLLGSLRIEVSKDFALRDAARLDLIATLVKEGYRVALLALDPNLYVLENPNFMQEARNAGLQEQDVVVTYPLHGTDVRTIVFPRDIFRQLGRTLYFNKDYCYMYLDGQSLLGESAWKTSFYTSIGCGGEVVMGDTFAFACRKHQSDCDEINFQNRLRNPRNPRGFLGMSFSADERPFFEEEPKETPESHIDRIERDLRVYGGMEKVFFRLPHCWVKAFPPAITEQLGSKKRIMLPYHHADMAVMWLPPENALFFLEPYYRENKDLIDRVVEGIRPKIFGTLPDEDGMPINSLPLPDGGVLMDKAAEQGRRILQEAGIKVITTSKPFGSWAWGSGGGIHCATNMLTMPD